AFRFWTAEGERGCQRSRARRIVSGSKEDTIRRRRGGRRCVRDGGSGAGDGAGRTSRSGSGRSSFADDSCASQRGAAAGRRCFTGGRRGGGVANIDDSSAAS